MRTVALLPASSSQALSSSHSQQNFFQRLLRLLLLPIQHALEPGTQLLEGLAVLARLLPFFAGLGHGDPRPRHRPREIGEGGGEGAGHDAMGADGL